MKGALLIGKVAEAFRQFRRRDRPAGGGAAVFPLFCLLRNQAGVGEREGQERKDQDNPDRRFDSPPERCFLLTSKHVLHYREAGKRCQDRSPGGFVLKVGCGHFSWNTNKQMVR